MVVELQIFASIANIYWLKIVYRDKCVWYWVAKAGQEVGHGKHHENPVPDDDKDEEGDDEEGFDDDNDDDVYFKMKRKIFFTSFF